MMHNARIGKTPMVVYAGQSPSNVLLQEPHLSGPLVEMARPIAKWAAQIEHAHDVPRALAAGLQDRRRTAPGPRLPGAADGCARRRGRDADHRPTTYTNWRARPDAAGLAEVADLLVKAQRPMLMVGDSVALADAQAEVARVAELLGCADVRVLRVRVQRRGRAIRSISAASTSCRRSRFASTLADCDVLFVVGRACLPAHLPGP